MRILMSYGLLGRGGDAVQVQNLGGLIPSSPGSMGTYHWLAVTTLGALGIARVDALSFALINHALWYVPPVGCGPRYSMEGESLRMGVVWSTSGIGVEGAA